MANVNFFSPDGGTTRYPIEDTEARSRIAGQQSLLKDTVGWTGKNLLKNTATTQTINGVTFTVNADGSVTVNGTATDVINFIVSDVMPFSSNSPYILNGCPAGGSYTTYRLDLRNSAGHADNDLVDYGDGCLCNKSGEYYVNIRIASGATVSNLTFYPMIRDAFITDDTYEPYHKNVEDLVEQVYVDNGVLGAKNLLKQLHGTETKNGVTFTQNTDGSVTVNGTATANTGHEMITISDTGINGSFKLPVGRYILSGCPKDGSWETYSLYLQMMDNNSTWLSPQYKDEGNGVEFDITETNKDYRFIVSIRAQNGVAISNVKFYPMLRLASDPDDTYVPYAMTNKELTEKKINIADLKTVVSASSDFTDFKTRIASL